MGTLAIGRPTVKASRATNTTVATPNVGEIAEQTRSLLDDVGRTCDDFAGTLVCSASLCVTGENESQGKDEENEAENDTLHKRENCARQRVRKN